MRILLTNDDGIHSPGLWHLHKQLSPKHRLTVVAPRNEQSGIAHAFTLHTPLRVNPVRLDAKRRGWAVLGTPADCVKIGITRIMKAKPDLVIAGINPGDNAGISHYYSGTVGAARESALLGIPAIAVSVSLIDDAQFRAAARFLDSLISALRSFPKKEVLLLNVNFPPVRPEKIKGVRITRQGCAMFKDRYLQRTDTRGGRYYWILGDKQSSDFAGDSDDRSLGEGYITITPLRVDATHDEVRSQLADRLGTAFPQWSGRPAKRK